MALTPSEPSLDVVETGDRIDTRVEGCNCLTDSNIDPLNRRFDALLHTLAGREGWHLVVDLGLIEFLSSAAVAAFLVLNRRSMTGKGRLTLVNARPSIRQVFAVTRLDRVVDIRTSIDPAPQPDVG